MSNETRNVADVKFHTVECDVENSGLGWAGLPGCQAILILFGFNYLVQDFLGIVISGNRSRAAINYVIVTTNWIIESQVHTASVGAG